MSGGGTGTSKDQLKRENDLQQQQLDQQKAIRDQIMGGIGKYLSGGVGFDPAQFSAMQSQFLNNNTANFGAAGQAIKSALASRGASGGDLPVGGDFVRGIASLEGAKASSQSQGLLGLNIQNAQQALNNQFNAASVASGQSAQLGNNVGIFGQGASNALSNYVQASGNGFFSQFGRGLGQGLGMGAGAVATGGIGAALGGIGKYLGKGGGGGITTDPNQIGFCWIAEEIYGKDSPKTHAIRAWLDGTYRFDPIGQHFVALYEKHGERMAELIKHDPELRASIKPLFDEFAIQAAMTQPEDYESMRYQR